MTGNFRVQIALDCILEYLNFQNFPGGARTPEHLWFLVLSALIVNTVMPILHILPVIPHYGKNPAS